MFFTRFSAQLKNNLSSMTSNNANYISHSTSQTIDALRVVLLGLIIFIHYPITVSSYTPVINIGDFNILDSTQIFMQHVATACAVPCFFVFSGYFFFKEGTLYPKLYKKKIRSRGHTLLIPYIIWNVLMLIFCLGLSYLNESGEFNIAKQIKELGGLHIFWDSQIWGEENYNWLGCNVPWSGPIDLQLWFVRNLMVYTLVSPIIYAIIKYLKKISIIILALCFVSGIFINVPGINASSFFFFTFGSYFSINKLDILDCLGKYKIWFSFIFFIFLFLSLLITENQTVNLIRPFFIISYVMAALSISKSIFKKFPKVSGLLYKNSNSTFFIYAFHTFVIQILVIIIPRVGDQLLGTIIYLASGISVWFIARFAFDVIKKGSPSLLKILNGSR